MLREKRLQWFGYKKRRELEYARESLRMNHLEWRTRRSKLRWMDIIREDTKDLDPEEKDTMARQLQSYGIQTGYPNVCRTC